MMTDEKVASVFYETANGKIHEAFKDVMMPLRLRAPIRAYVEWIHALKTIVEWENFDDPDNPEVNVRLADRLNKKADLDKAIAEFDVSQPDRWQCCAALITHIIWKVKTGGELDNRIIEKYGKKYPDENVFVKINQAFQDLYENEARKEEPGPCSLFYFAQAAMLLRSADFAVIDFAPPATSFYMHAVQTCLNASAVLNFGQDSIQNPAEGAPRLYEFKRQLEETIYSINETVKSIEQSIAETRKQIDELKRQLEKVTDAIGRGGGRKRPGWIWRASRSRGKLRQMNAQAELWPNLDFLKLRMVETRTQLDEKKSGVERRLEGKPAKPENTAPTLSFVSYMCTQFSGNPRRMTGAGWTRLLGMGVAFLFLLAAVIVGVVAFVFWTNGTPPAV